jgi:hypothetical protein
MKIGYAIFGRPPENKKYKIERIGNISIREVPGKEHNSRRKTREYKPHPPKQSGIDLGAGVVQSHGRRHIKL